MDLLKLSKAAATIQPSHSILIYGPPKSGKTQLLGTAATIPEISKIWYFGLENGHETLLTMGLSDSEMEKIVVIKVDDTRDNPRGIETILKAFSAKSPVQICEIHGTVNCGVCMKESAPSIDFCLANCTHNELVVIDSGSQLGDSALAAACLGKPGMFKPTFDEYGMVNKWLGDVMSVVQQASTTNFVVLTHEIALEDDEGKDKIFPLLGSKNFSMKCSKYFGTVAYVHKKMNKHVAGSSSTYRHDVLTGSRVNAKIEESKNPSMYDILIKGGIIKIGSSSAPPTAPASAPQVSPTQVSSTKQETKVDNIPLKPLTLAERLAAKTKQTT